jgi:hypothetical protein
MNDLAADILSRLTDFPMAAYCEHAFLRRLDQPFNVYSNIAFLIAAVLVVWLRRRQPSRSSWFIAALLVATGATGAWWHVAMTPAAHTADLIASGALSMLMAYLVMRYVFYRPVWMCVGVLPLLYIAGMGLPVESGQWIAPGSVPILPAAALLFMSGAWLALRRSIAGLYLLMASFWLAGGFILLGIDRPGCGIIPIGTHFGWHLLAAATVLTLARAIAGADVELLDYGQDDETPPGKPEASNENRDPDVMTPEELEAIPHGMPPDRVDPRDL